VFFLSNGAKNKKQTQMKRKHVVGALALILVVVTNFVLRAEFCEVLFDCYWRELNNTNTTTLFEVFEVPFKDGVYSVYRGATDPGCKCVTSTPDASTVGETSVAFRLRFSRSGKTR
jgi:hypothetical protein